MIMKVSAQDTPWSNSIWTVTPALAEQILKENNIDNRKLRHQVVTRYAEIIKRGEWKLSPEPICFAPDGRLLNGQHRLSAIAKTGLSVKLAVSENVPEEVFAVLDRGASRSVSDSTGLQHQLISISRVMLLTKYKRVQQTDSLIESMVHAISQAYSDLVSQAGNNRRAFASAPFKAAAITRIMEGNGEYAKAMYKALVHDDILSMSPFILTAYKRESDFAKTSGNGGITAQLVNLEKAYQLFDEENANKKSLRFSSHPGASEAIKKILAGIENPQLAGVA